MQVSRLKRTCVVLFLLLNLLGIYLFNRPSGWALTWGRSPSPGTDPRLARALTWTEYYVWWYAYVAGIDQRYTMFSTVHRGWYFFRYLAEDAKGNLIELPIELQKGRTFFQRHFFDHKAGKFQLNTFSNEAARRSYASYLCREYRYRLDSIPVAIRAELHSQQFVSREVAQETGSHIAGPTAMARSDRFPCAGHL